MRVECVTVQVRWSQSSVGGLGEEEDCAGVVELVYLEGERSVMLDGVAAMMTSGVTVPS